MSSWYDPPEDGPGTVAGPDWYVTTYTMNERDEELVCDLAEVPRRTAYLKELAKQGYEVFIRYGYVWKVPGEHEWYYEQTYEDASAACGDAIMQSEEDACDAMVDAALEARHDRD
jgi:hypothetical protein